MELPTHVKEYIVHHQVLNLSYSNDEGVQACAVFYVWTADNRFAFLSDRKTRHGQAFLERKTPVAFTINDDNQTWNTLKGVQGRGIVQKVSESGVKQLKEAYLRRFPFILESPLLSSMFWEIDFWEVIPL